MHHCRTSILVVVLWSVFAFHGSAFAGDATLTWDPNSEPDLAGYRVHYGTSSSVYSTVVDVGNVTTHVVTGLGVGTYYFAITAYNTSSGESLYSNQVSKTFADTTPAIISAIASNNVTTSGATISWTTNEAATSQVEYGTTTTYGSSSTLNTVPVLAHSRTLTGLAPATLYHYRVRSVDAAGNVALSGDNTFTTMAAPDTTPPVISGIGSSNVTASGATIGWTTDENATSQVEYGTTAAYGSSSALNSSPVRAHSRTLSGLAPATLYHYRVRSVDAAGNAALSGDNTFTTAPAPDTTAPVLSNIAVGNLTSTGATVTWATNEGATSLVEYGTTTAYGSATSESTTPAVSHSRGLTGLAPATTYHFRVKSRDAAGNLATSGDSTFATLAAPDITPPTISGVTASGSTATSTIITWNTNESATSLVEYGTTTAYGSSSALNTTPVTSHSRTLTGLLSATTYQYRVKSTDGAGNVGVSSNQTFTTTTAPDTTPPVISSVTATAITFNSAQITWTTNEAGTSLVQYSTNLTFGLSSSLNSTPVTSHSRTLTGLAAATVYNYRVRTTDAAGNVATSPASTFTTAAAPDTTPPVISTVAAGNVTATSAVITWRTNEPSNSLVEYGPTTAYGSQSPLSATLVTDHTSTVTGLTAGTAYFFRVRSADAAGNIAASAGATFATAAAPDTTPPVISAVAVGNVTAASAVISWMTNEPASSLVEYGPTAAYGSQSPLNATLVPNHAYTVLGLTAGTTYSFRVRSADAAGNVATSAGSTFSTTVSLDTVPPGDVRGFAARGWNQHVVLTWINPPDSDFVGVRISYRTDRLPTGIDDGTMLGDVTGQPGQDMNITHADLLNGVTYYYAAAAYDANGNQQNTVFASATPVAPAVDSDLEPAGGCGMIVPRNGGPPGPWKAADLIVTAAVALFMMKRRWRPLIRYEGGLGARSIGV